MKLLITDAKQTAKLTKYLPETLSDTAAGWSMGALYEILPATFYYDDSEYTLHIEKSDYGNEHCVWYEDNSTGDVWGEKWSDNILDAMIDMIIDLFDNEYIAVNDEGEIIYI